MTAGRPAPRLLIVNADDFGLTPGVSRASSGPPRRHRHHHVGAGRRPRRSRPSAAGARATRRPRHRRPPRRGRRGPAAAQRPRGPDARRRRGALRPRRGGSSCPRAAAGRVDPDDLRREFAAQLERVARRRRAARPTSTPTSTCTCGRSVRDVVLDLAAAAGIRACGSPASAAGRPVGVDRRPPRRRLERRGHRAGLPLPGHSTGLDEAGTLDAPALVAALERLGAEPGPARPSWPPTPAGPTTPSAPLPVGLPVGRRAGRPALARTCAGAVVGAGFRLGTFADLGPRP